MGAMHINGQKVAGVNIEIKPEIYSTEEREIGVWTDGKPLYEKTVYCPNIVKGQDNLVNHEVSNLETVVKIWGRCEYNNSGEILPLPYISSQSGYYIILGNVTNTRFQVSPGANFTSIENCYVTIQYTKTTDQPGAGTWTPDGVYAHHYSTDEKVVGIWVDGSTLYEKTIDFGTLPNATTKRVNHLIENVNDIWITDGFANNPTSRFTQQLSLSGITINDQFTFGVNNTYVQCITNSDRSAYTNCFVTLRYTKSSQ